MKRSRSAATRPRSVIDQLIDNILALPDTFPEAALPFDASAFDALRCSDQLPRLRSDHGWRWTPQDAFADLADGVLSGSRLAAAQTNGALIAPLSFDRDTAEGAMLFAFGADRAEAQAALEAVRGVPFGERLADSEQAAMEALGDAPLPDPALGERVTEVAERALVNLYVARDRRSGSIVASVTRQPPYALDWPRDGAFFDVALDIAGRGDWVSQRLRWYAGARQRGRQLRAHLHLAGVRRGLRRPARRRPPRPRRRRRRASPHLRRADELGDAKRSPFVPGASLARALARSPARRGPSLGAPLSLVATV